MLGKQISRRGAIRLATALGVSAPAVWTGERAFGAQQITVADVGGAPGAAIRKAFYEPFEKETGVNVIGVAHETDPVTQYKLIVETGSHLWDVCSVTPIDLALINRSKDHTEPLNIPASEFPTIIPGMLTPNWAGFSIWITILAYRTDKFANGQGPQSWSDFWDVKKFPGRRALYKGPQGTLECALLAAGVPADKLYPLNVDLAFQMLDRIKHDVHVWWSTGAQNTQVLQSGEVAATPTWGSRAYAAIDGGAPVKVIWENGLYSSDGWTIVKGTPRVDLARQFVKFCMRAKQQAIYANSVANAPSNTQAFQFIAPDRAERLATSPAHIKVVHPRNELWWATNRDPVQERFDNWLLS